MAEEAISIMLVDFHPIALDATAYLHVLSEGDATVAILALCRPDDLVIALQAKAEGTLSDVLTLPLIKEHVLAQVCKAAASSTLSRLASEIPDVADKILVADSRQSVLSLLSELLVGEKRSVYSSLSADLRLGITGWQNAIFANKAQRRVLDSLVNLLLRLAQQVFNRIDDVSQNEKSTEYDELSGVYNRLGLMNALKREMERTERYGSLLALMILDLDDFGAVNTNFGRQTGDRILKGLGNVLDGVTRRTDIIARLGNDEFCLLMPGLNLNQAIQAVQRVRKEVRSWADAAMHEVPVSMSFGVASHRGGGERPEQLLSDAMAALTHARAQGTASIGLYDGELQIAKA